MRKTTASIAFLSLATVACGEPFATITTKIYLEGVEYLLDGEVVCSVEEKAGVCEIPVDSAGFYEISARKTSSSVFGWKFAENPMKAEVTTEGKEYRLEWEEYGIPLDGRYTSGALSFTFKTEAMDGRLIATSPQFNEPLHIKDNAFSSDFPGAPEHSLRTYGGILTDGCTIGWYQAAKRATVANPNLINAYYTSEKCQ